MPHTRSKRAKAAAQAAASAKPVHTKRIQVLDEEGWTHVVDTARKTKAIAPAKDTLQVGDFEQNGIHYVNKTQEEYSKDLSTHTKAWKGAQGAQLREKIVEIKEGLRGREVRNVVCLGLGSLQSARREGRRASWTQLVALRGIVEVLGMSLLLLLDKRVLIDVVGGGEEIQCVFQDPQFSAADKVFLSSLGYEVVDDPEAFAKITEDSLVYAIHCYPDVYKSVSEGPRPVVLVGTDVEKFRKFDTYVFVASQWV